VTDDRQTDRITKTCVGIGHILRCKSES